ncbi:hypothetical protein VNO77_24683 [Canavalia gladiata]|uniref:Uncharacterized protein n=1 Tax=Canavalia gladiata TaxID=3824 RepID=A0AAN9LC33_CANGL
MMQMEPQRQLSSSPSFSSYSSDNFAQIAARVVHELRTDTLLDSTQEENDNNLTPQPNDDLVVDDFEFSFVSRHPDSSPVSADDIFYNGQIRPTYPTFHTKLLNDAETQPLGPRPRRLPLRKLMFEEQETVNNSNELDGVAPGTYCVWTPPCKAKKSSSTGSSSSKRWKLRDLLLLRSHSDGKKDSLLFQGPAKRTNKVAPKHSSADNSGPGAAAKLVGFFSNANGLARNSQPFSM